MYVNKCVFVLLCLHLKRRGGWEEVGRGGTLFMYLMCTTGGNIRNNKQLKVNYLGLLKMNHVCLVGNIL